MNLSTFCNIATAVIFGVVGLCIGSFLNVVIYRLPNHMSLATPPSHCTRCGYRLHWYDNIPIYSYLILHGRCRRCKTKISPRYVIVEAVTMILYLLCYFSFGFSDVRSAILSITSALAVSVCICIAAIDLEHKIIYDRFQLIMAGLAIVFIIADKDSSIIGNIISAVIAFVALYIIDLFVSKKAGRDALGGGDIKFAFVSALFLGWERVICMWIIASLSSLVYIAVGSLLEKRSARQGTESDSDAEYPFGPFLVLGFVVMLLFGTKIISAYMGLLGM